MDDKLRRRFTKAPTQPSTAGADRSKQRSKHASLGLGPSKNPRQGLGPSKNPRQVLGPPQNPKLGGGPLSEPTVRIPPLQSTRPQEILRASQRDKEFSKKFRQNSRLSDESVGRVGPSKRLRVAPESAKKAGAPVLSSQKTVKARSADRKPNRLKAATSKTHYEELLDCTYDDEGGAISADASAATLESAGQGRTESSTSSFIELDASLELALALQAAGPLPEGSCGECGYSYADTVEESLGSAATSTLGTSESVGPQATATTVFVKDVVPTFTTAPAPVPSATVSSDSISSFVVAADKPSLLRARLVRAAPLAFTPRDEIPRFSRQSPAGSTIVPAESVPSFLAPPRVVLPDTFQQKFLRSPYTPPVPPSSSGTEHIGTKLEAVSASSETAGLGPVTLMSSLWGRMDAFVVNTKGVVLAASYGISEPGVGYGVPPNEWSLWQELSGISVAPCAPITAISRREGKIDLFAVDINGEVFNSEWDATRSGGTFSGWTTTSPGGTFRTALHGSVGAAVLSGDDLFFCAVGLDGRVYVSRWIEGLWAGWWDFHEGLDDVRVPPGAPIGVSQRIQLFQNVAVVIDLCLVGADGNVYWKGVRKYVNYAEGTHSLVWGPWRKFAPPSPLAPRTPVTVVRRQNDNLEIFVASPEGQIMAATAVAPSTGDWGFSLRVRRRVGQPVFLASSWTALEGITVPVRAAVTAVRSKTFDALDIFAVNTDGLIGHMHVDAGGNPASSRFEVLPLQQPSSWRTLPGLAVGGISRSQDQLDIAWPEMQGNILTKTKRRTEPWYGGLGVVPFAHTGMTDPRVGEWKKVAVRTKSEVGPLFYSWNTDWSEEAQGMTTDGDSWYLVSNNRGDDMQKLWKYDSLFNRINSVWAPKVVRDRRDEGDNSSHIGAPGYFDGWVYVPLQRPHGVWKVKADLSEGPFVLANPLPKFDSFAWCAVNPLNGRLYTGDYRGTLRLFAFDKEFSSSEGTPTLIRHDEDDIVLSPPDREFKDIQGGVFTRGGKVILVRGTESGPATLFCFSAITGQFLGSLPLGDFPHDYSEVESVTVRAGIWPAVVSVNQASGGRFGTPTQLTFGPVRLDVHVLELDNDAPDNDNCNLWSYAVPEPDLL